MNKKVLLISHNALGKQNNMARTLENQFFGFKKNMIAQLFFSDEIPDSDYCKDFFRISDSDIIHSIFSRKGAGEIITTGSKEIIRNEYNWIKTKIRKKGNRIPYIYILRNLIWSVGKWKSKKMDCWLNKFNPDLIYFASGDYSFSYKVTLYIAKKRNIPLIIGCYDDFYIDKKNTINPLYKYAYNNLMINVKKLFNYSSAFTALSEMMVKDYTKLFHKRGFTFFTPTILIDKKENFKRNESIIYAGNLGHGRAEQLVVIGKTLKKIGLPSLDFISVYSGEIRKELTDMMNMDNGIKFCGKISVDEVHELLITSKYVIHTESFQDIFARRVKYSLSTKIADYLGSGACIIAFGPKEVASISYLEKEKAALVISNENELESKLKELFSNPNISFEICKSARNLAHKNHNNLKTKEILFNIIRSIQI